MKLTYIAPLSFLAASLSAQSYLDTWVASPHRYDRALLDSTSSATVLSAEQIGMYGTVSLSDVLETVTGVNVAQNGPIGAASSIFVRGTESDHTLFVIDGIRVSDSNTAYGNFFGGAVPAGVSQIEIVRGPHSVLYGADALGGVVSIRTAKGQGEPSYSISGAYGSNDTYAGSISGSGESGPWAFSFELAGLTTDNERPNNAFDSEQFTLRLDYTLNESWSLGTTLRYNDQRYGSPNSRFVNDLDNEDSEEQFLGTLFVEGQIGDAWETRLTVGHQDLEFRSEDPSFDAVTVVDSSRWVIDWQNTLRTGDHTLTFGYTGEYSENTSTGFGSIDEEQYSHGLFLEDYWELSEDISASLALRVDEFESFGSQFTWKAGALWKVVPERLRLRANVGTGFRAPGFLELFADSPFFVGNPDLAPEESLAWGVDVEAIALEGALTARLGWFQNELDNLITGDFGVFPGTSFNIDEARTRGVELDLRYQPVGSGHQLSASYTWLEAVDIESNLRLLRRPEHTSTFQYRYEASQWSGGVLARWVVGREDIDAATFARIDGEDFFTVDASLSYSFSEELTLRLSGGNLLDESYESVHGFPALGRSLLGQLVYEF